MLCPSPSGYGALIPIDVSSGVYSNFLGVAGVLYSLRPEADIRSLCWGAIAGFTVHLKPPYSLERGWSWWGGDAGAPQIPPQHGLRSAFTGGPGRLPSGPGLVLRAPSGT